MPDPQPQLQPQQTTDQVVEACSTAIGRNVLGRELTAAEAEAMKTIFNAAAQALADGFIQRLANHVLAERRDESIEEFFGDKLKTD
ncbi:MAG: hypothetical protein ACLQU5_00270 [Isosphaeraceae bacterium]